MKGLHQQSRILSVLAKHHLIDTARIPLITNKYAEQHKPFINFLIEDNSLNALDLAQIFSINFGIPLFDLSQFNISHIPQSTKNEALMRKHHALPLYLRGRILFVAMADPTDVDALEEIQFNTGYTTELVMVSEPVLAKLIDKVFEDSATTLNMGNIDNDALSKIEIQEDTSLDKTDTSDTDDAPIIQYLNKILFDAIKKGASDLHFEPYEKAFRIRFRIDGILTEVAHPPVNLSARMAASLKVMSKLDIAERRLPQDGRLKLTLSKNKAIDFRVSTLPTMWGEKIVMRILDSSSAMLGIDMLGYEPAQKEIYMQALAQPQGMVLVTGPTGSGKTVSLYTGLNILNTPAHNISTAEDPVEMNLTGINQVQINLKAGLNFPNILRSFLRQDPDVIMVGEIRDLDTAEIAIKASQTGHLVLSTLHTNSAAETLTRLLNMGVPSYNIASSVSVIIAQRLARKLCEHCKEEIHVPAAELLKQGFTQAQLQTAVIYKHVGCEHCTNGYKGRLGVYEVVKISDEVSSIIMSGGNSIDIAEQFQQEGYHNLRQSGLLKVLQGITSLEEINRITNN